MDFWVSWWMLCSAAYLKGSCTAFITGVLGQMNHLLEVSTAIYFLICLRHNSATFNNKHFSARRRPWWQQILTASNQSLPNCVFWNISFAFCLRKLNVLEQLTVWHYFWMSLTQWSKSGLISNLKLNPISATLLWEGLAVCGISLMMVDDGGLFQP